MDPNKKTQTLIEVRHFLRRLADPKMIKKLTRRERFLAARYLENLINEFDIAEISKKLPHILGNARDF